MIGPGWTRPAQAGQGRPGLARASGNLHLELLTGLGRPGLAWAGLGLARPALFSDFYWPGLAWAGPGRPCPVWASPGRPGLARASPARPLFCAGKEARDILKECGLRRLPSEYKDQSIEKINKKLEKAREELNIIKIKLKDSAIAKFNIKEGFETASPLKKRPQPKTLDLIEKHDTLRRYIYNLNNLKLLKENISPKTGKGIIHFSNPQQLVKRLELLAGSILAGNNGVKQEFSQIAHLLHQLKVITKKTLNDLLKKYILFK